MRVEADRPPQRFDRAVEVAKLAAGIAKIVPALPVSGHCGDDPLITFDGGREIAGILRAEPAQPIEAHRPIARRQRLRDDPDQFGIVTELGERGCEIGGHQGVVRAGGPRLLQMPRPGIEIAGTAIKSSKHGAERGAISAGGKPTLRDPARVRQPAAACRVDGVANDGDGILVEVGAVLTSAVLAQMRWHGSGWTGKEKGGGS